MESVRASGNSEARIPEIKENSSDSSQGEARKSLGKTRSNPQENVTDFSSADFGVHISRYLNRDLTSERVP